MKAITVYCASSASLAPEFHDVAVALGRALGARGIGLVYGGGRVGLMGEVASAARAAGSRVTGIITTYLYHRERADEACDELVVVDTMRERKQLLAERGDGFVVLPGGIGTYEEFFEILVGRQLDEHRKPIGIVNAHGYYNPLVALIEHGIEHRFIRESVYDLFTIHPEPADVIDWMTAHEPGAPAAPSARRDVPAAG